MPFPVYFATNRNLIVSPVVNNFGTDFSADGSVAFGRAVIGKVDDESEIGNSNLSIDSLSTLTFLDALQTEIVEGAPNHLLVYLHGFDYRFREVLMRAAYLNNWYGGGAPSVKSTAICFSWPSQGCLNIDAYKTDYKNATNSGGAFRIFLQALIPLLRQYKALKPDRRITIMAHSLGNHFLRSGLEAAIGDAPGQIQGDSLKGLVDRVILAASDEESDNLSRPSGLSQLLSFADRVYVYYNNQDIPLNALSRPINGTSRLGIDGPPDKTSFVGHNITFVNCSAANPEIKGVRLDPEWHQYYRLVPAVRDDICSVMSSIADAQIKNRVYRPNGNYYRLDVGSMS